MLTDTVTANQGKQHKIKIPPLASVSALNKGNTLRSLQQPLRPLTPGMTSPCLRCDLYTSRGWETFLTCCQDENATHESGFARRKSVSDYAEIRYQPLARREK
ncbi:uncharacterized [Tachysurus ichikawai]